MPGFVPKQYKKEAITVRIPYDRLEKIDALAASYGISRSAFINQCIDYAMEYLSDKIDSSDDPKE